MIKYFTTRNLGFSIPDHSVKDVFDVDLPPKQFVFEITRFVKQQKPTHLFLYVTTHGWRGKINDQRDSLFIALPRSTFHDDDTYLDFESLVSSVNTAFDGHAYYIVDCCYSGLIHRISDMHNRNAPPTAQSRQTDKGPHAKSTTFITSNNSASVGEVIARDKLPGVHAPLFTTALLDLLRNGAPKPAQPFLSIEAVCADLQTRIPQLVNQTNEELIKRDDPALLVLDKMGYWKPGYSHRYFTTDYNIRPQTPFFQNNHNDHFNTKELTEAHRAREGSLDFMTHEAKIREIEAVVNTAKHDNEEKKARIEQLNGEKQYLDRNLERLTEERREQQTANDKLRNELRMLNENYNKSQNETTRLNQELTTESDDLRKSLQRLEEKHNDSHDEIGRLNHDKQELQTNIQNLHEVNNQLKVRNEELQKDNDHLEKTVQKQASDLDDKAKEVAVLRTRHRRAWVVVGLIVLMISIGVLAWHQGPTMY